MQFLTYKETAADLSARIRSREPFVVTRLGDGEIDTLVRRPSIASKICRVWGYSLEDEQDQAFQELGEVLLTALRHSDILGFLNLQDGKENRVKVKRSRGRAWRIPQATLDLHSIDLSDKTIIDHQFFRSQDFGCLGNLQTIVGDAPLHIVSPYAEVVATNLGKRLTNPIRATVTNRDIFFRDREPEFEMIQSRVGRGEVVFWACSGGYKDLGVTLKRNVGAMAIDIGATMDAWAGILSRKWFQEKGCQRYLVLGKEP